MVIECFQATNITNIPVALELSLHFYAHLEHGAFLLK